MKIIVCLALNLLTLVAWADPVTELYSPSHKTAQVLIAGLQPIYGEDAKISAQQQHIIVRAEQPVVAQILELLMMLDQPPKQFFVELSHQIPRQNDRHYSTQGRSTQQNTFSISENSPLIIAREQQQQQLSGLGVLWVSIDTARTNSDYLQLTVESAADTVYIDYHWQTIKHGQAFNQKNRISGPQGEWLLITAVPADDKREKNWSTRPRDNDAPIYIRVYPAQPVASEQ
jgi:hypothetical protein